MRPRPRASRARRLHRALAGRFLHHSDNPVRRGDPEELTRLVHQHDAAGIPADGGDRDPGDALQQRQACRGRFRVSRAALSCSPGRCRAAAAVGTLGTRASVWPRGDQLEGCESANGSGTCPSAGRVVGGPVVARHPLDLQAAEAPRRVALRACVAWGAPGGVSLRAGVGGDGAPGTALGSPRPGAARPAAPSAAPAASSVELVGGRSSRVDISSTVSTMAGGLR